MAAFLFSKSVVECDFVFDQMIALPALQEWQCAVPCGKPSIWTRRSDGSGPDLCWHIGQQDGPEWSHEREAPCGILGAP